MNRSFAASDAHKVGPVAQYLRLFKAPLLQTFAPLRLCVRFSSLLARDALKNQHLIPFGDLAQDPGCIPVC
jgi:hypothetical protein